MPDTPDHSLYGALRRFHGDALPPHWCRRCQEWHTHPQQRHPPMRSHYRRARGLAPCSRPVRPVNQRRGLQEARRMSGHIIFSDDLFEASSIRFVEPVFTEVLNRSLKAPEAVVSTLPLTQGPSALADMGLTDVARTDCPRDSSVVELLQIQPRRRCRQERIPVFSAHVRGIGPAIGSARPLAGPARASPRDHGRGAPPCRGALRHRLAGYQHVLDEASRRCGPFQGWPGGAQGPGSPTVHVDPHPPGYSLRDPRNLQHLDRALLPQQGQVPLAHGHCSNFRVPGP